MNLSGSSQSGFRLAREFRQNVLAKEGRYFPRLLFSLKNFSSKAGASPLGSLWSHCSLLTPHAESRPSHGHSSDPGAAACGKTICVKEKGGQEIGRTKGHLVENTGCRFHCLQNCSSKVLCCPSSDPGVLRKTSSQSTFRGRPRVPVIRPSFPDGLFLLQSPTKSHDPTSRQG